MSEWNVSEIVLCCLLFSFLLWKEITRKNKSYLFLRITAAILAVISLASMALPVRFNKKKTVLSNQQAVLLTEGFNADSVNRFLKNNGTNIPVICLDEHIKNNNSFKADYVADVRLLSQQYKDIRAFHLFGFGLDEDELNAMQGNEIVFHQSKLLSGFTSIHWLQKIKSGDELIIQGSYNNTTSAKTKIVVSSFDTVLDSAFIFPNRQNAFTLATIPKVEGRATFSLYAITNKDTVEKEMIPVLVEKGKPLQMLMLASSPGFENRFLKNNLSQRGFGIVTRTTISRNKYAYDYINTSSVAVNHITTSLLKRFDILMADATELASLSKPELVVIQQQVAQKNMGLLIKADTAVSSAFYASRFQLTTNRNALQKLQLQLSDTSQKLPALPVSNSYFIRDQNHAKPIVRDKENRIYAGSKLYGSGRIVFTTLANTYLWFLSGNEEAYNRYWTSLLNEAAAPHEAEEAWRISPALPSVNSPVTIRLQTNQTSIPQAQINGVSVYLKQNPDLPYQWNGTYYPRKKGWQTGIGLTGNAFYWYVFNKVDWQHIRASQKIVATNQFVSEYWSLPKTKKIDTITKKLAVPKYIFYLFFLLCAGFLWAESKQLFAANT